MTNQLYYNKYPQYKYNCIDAYIEVNNPQERKDCPNCNLKPLVWEFDNGRYAGCGCGNNKYDHFTIKAESIGDYVRRNNGSVVGYNGKELQENWNKYVDESILVT